jgi:nicotinate dehydrogenase subunit B
VDLASGRVHLRRFLLANHCGPISNPDGMRNQIEGGVLQGASRTLGEEITWDDRKVTSIDWQSYNTLPLGLEVPVIESVLIDRPDVKATGTGETAITLAAAAIGNAIFGRHRGTNPSSADHARSRESRAGQAWIGEDMAK